MDFQLLLTFQRLCQPWASFPGGGCSHTLVHHPHPSFLLPYSWPVSFVYITCLALVGVWQIRESTITYSFYGWLPDETYLKGDGRARIRDELLNSFGKISFALGLDLNQMETFKNFEQPTSRKPISESDACTFTRRTHMTL